MWLATRASVRPLPWFHHSCIAWITSCRLCSSACSVGSCCSGGHTCHTLTVPCQDPLARPQQVQFGIRRAPSAPSSSCPWQRGLWGQHCPAEHRESLQQLPCCPWSEGGAAAHGHKEPVLQGLIPSLCEEQPRDLQPWELSTGTQVWNSLQQARQELRLLRNGALRSLLLKALYNPSMRCAMKCKVLL